MKRQSEGPYWPIATEKPWHQCTWDPDDGSRTNPHDSALFDVSPHECAHFTTEWDKKDWPSCLRWLLRFDPVSERINARIIRGDAKMAELTDRARVVHDVLELRLATLFVGRRLVDLLKRNPLTTRDFAGSLHEHPLRMMFLVNTPPSLS